MSMRIDSEKEWKDAVETTAQRSSGEGEGEGGDRTDADDSVVDLAGPSGGLSVLTFG